MKTQIQKLYRQGDVQIAYVDSLPKNLKAVLRQAGRLIVAVGNNGSGHSHYIDGAGTELFANEDSDLFLKIHGAPVKGRFRIVKHNELHLLLSHPTLGIVAFDEDDVKIVGKFATVDGTFELLHHDSKPQLDHYPQALPRGFAAVEG